MNPAVIRKLQVDDLQEVTWIHLAAFPKSALGHLGREAVERYYQWQLQGPHDVVALGIYCEESLAGFCFAGIFQGALSGFLLKNRTFLVWRILSHPWLIATPIFRERLNLAWTLLMRRTIPAVLPSASPHRSFGILAIAVNPQMQGAGYGSQLMFEVERLTVDRGIVNLHLTVAVENYQAINFYEKLGWQKLLASDGIWHGSMVKFLESICE